MVYLSHLEVLRLNVCATMSGLCHCLTTFPEEMKHTCLLTPDRELTADQSGADTSLVNHEFYQGLLNRNNGCGVTGEVTQKLLHHQSPLQHGWQLPKQGIWSTFAQPSGSSIGWRVTFLGASVGLNLFQAVLFVWVSLQFFPPLFCLLASSPLRGTLSFYSLLWQRGSSESTQF